MQDKNVRLSVELTNLQKDILWNIFDELLMMEGRYRTPGESNETIKSRIKRIGRYLPGVNAQGLLNGLYEDLTDDNPYNYQSKKWYYLNNQPLDYSGYLYLYGSENGWIEPVMYVNEELYLPMSSPNTEGDIDDGWYIPWDINGYHRLAYIKDVLENNSTLKFEYLIKYFDSADQTYKARLYSDNGYSIDIYGNYLDYDERLIYQSGEQGDITLHCFRDEQFLIDHGYLDEYKRPTKKLKEFIHECRKVAPIYWGEVKWDEDYFDMASQFGVGQETTTSIFDAGKVSPLSNKQHDQVDPPDARYGLTPYGYSVYDDDPNGTYLEEITYSGTVLGYNLYVSYSGEDPFYFVWICNSGYFGDLVGTTQFRTTTNEVEYHIIDSDGAIHVIAVDSIGHQSNYIELIL